MRAITVLGATALVLAASTAVFGMSLNAPRSPDATFSVFFDPGAASLSGEAREIISIAAQRFAATRNVRSATRILVASETDDQDSASISKERIKAVANQLAHDGIDMKFVSADEQPTTHTDAVRLQEGLNRRVSISIQETLVLGRL